MTPATRTESPITLIAKPSQYVDEISEIEAEKKKERLHVMLDFSFLKTYMEKGGLVMQVLRCPHCNATIEFPESGTQTKCSYCGNAIYAQDIFDKVKSLLE